MAILIDLGTSAEHIETGQLSYDTVYPFTITIVSRVVGASQACCSLLTCANARWLSLAGKSQAPSSSCLAEVSPWRLRCGLNTLH